MKRVLIVANPASSVYCNTRGGLSLQVNPGNGHLRRPTFLFPRSRGFSNLRRHDRETSWGNGTSLPYTPTPIIGTPLVYHPCQIQALICCQSPGGNINTGVPLILTVTNDQLQAGKGVGGGIPPPPPPIVEAPGCLPALPENHRL